MRFAILSIVLLLSFVSEAQSKVYKDSISTVSFDTITTDTAYIITETRFEQATSIDSAYCNIETSNDTKNALVDNETKISQKNKSEIESAMAELPEALEVTSRMFDVLVSSMDSTTLKCYLDSILTVSSGDLKTAIVKMNKYIRANNSSTIFNGLDLITKFVHVQMNGKMIGASELDPLFIKTVTIDDLKQTTANFSVIKEKIERLKTDHSGKVTASEMFNQCQALIQDPLVVRVFKNAMSQAQSAENKRNIHTVTKSITTRVTYTVKRDNEINQKP